MKVLELQNISKSFGEKHVLKDLSLEIEQGEFVTFLGPSGCGKTTMLKIIAGLEKADNGKVFLNGNDITNLPPEKRMLNTVFQNYALFPHMNVEKNIEYGLKLKGIDKKERKKTVKNMLDTVKLSGYEKYSVNELSGGEKQRVAIARAAVNKPSVLLLDEPLGALDLKLRQYLQNELKALQKKLGMTFIYITHDQEEAMNMSDRIYVMNNGNFEQFGTPAEIYDHPKTRFIASFVGSANILDAKIIDINNNNAVLSIAGQNILIPIKKDMKKGNITLAVRSENVILSHEESAGSLKAVITDKAYVNGIFRTKSTTVDGNEIMSTSYSMDDDYKVNDTVYITFNNDKIIYLTEEENEK